MNEELENNIDNTVAKVLTISAWIIYLVGLVVGIVCANVEVVRGTYYTYTDTEFSFAIAFTYWAIFFAAGTLFLGIAEIIKLLEEIKRK